jgi:hypothetical protein
MESKNLIKDYTKMRFDFKKNCLTLVNRYYKVGSLDLKEGLNITYKALLELA